MRIGRRSSEFLTYGNVVATLALFISLGGVSYAAIELPAKSVGPKQLQAGAVTPGALGFPLGVAGVTDERSQELVKGECNAPAPPGHAHQVACPIPLSSGIETPGREVRLTFPSSGSILVSAVAGLRYTGPPGTTASVSIDFVLDGRLLTRAGVTLAGGQELQIPDQTVARVPAGSHRVGVEFSAAYSSYEPGAVLVSTVSLIAAALPH
jgi:hypothetical protein